MHIHALPFPIRTIRLGTGRFPHGESSGAPSPMIQLESSDALIMFAIISHERGR